MAKYCIGLDFGTESARAVLVDVESGDLLATSVRSYKDGVIDRVLPESDVALPPDWALQNPQDWLSTMEDTIAEILEVGGVSPDAVIGLGVDFTACTILPCLEDGTPLCMLDAFRDRPHAWVKLWKHHAAQSQADRINELALGRGENWLARYGGKISSEWLLPKALEILEVAPDIYSAAERIVEGADWITWNLTGRLARNTCAAGYKATWHKKDGFPSPAFLDALHPDLQTLYLEKLHGPIMAPGMKVGGLTETWAERFGLRAGTPVGAGIIDAHAAVVGGGVAEPGTMFMIMGTSTCHMLLGASEVLVEGISGVVEDGIVPGYFGYEAGQVSVGDIFAWFVENGVPPACHEEASSEGKSLHDILSQKAARFAPGQTGLLALDWWNGCRTPLVDGELSGAMIGYTLQTPPEAIYRALIEATAYGTRLIIELFKEGGIPIKNLRVGGGLTKNALLLQIYADVIGLPIEIAPSQQASAKGAAILGAVAGGAYRNLGESIKRMSPPPSRKIVPEKESLEPYNQLFSEYRRLVKFFGRSSDSTLKRLRAIRSDYSTHID
jgi:L-ribulokinase